MKYSKPVFVKVSNGDVPEFILGAFGFSGSKWCFGCTNCNCN
ncbi:MAG: hypothetical protein VZQ78_09630 [Prevotella sp.]|nr:hypothetical protein [Prevotella sp.]